MLRCVVACKFEMSELVQVAVLLLVGVECQDIRYVDSHSVVRSSFDIGEASSYLVQV